MLTSFPGADVRDRCLLAKACGLSQPRHPRAEAAGDAVAAIEIPWGHCGYALPVATISTDLQSPRQIDEPVSFGESGGTCGWIRMTANAAGKTRRACCFGIKTLSTRSPQAWRLDHPDRSGIESKQPGIESYPADGNLKA